jgi:ribosomal-protein-alanine N-acetyltransferase
MRTHAAVATGRSVYLRPPTRSDERSFLAAARASAKLHGAWVRAPSTPRAYAAFLARNASRAALPTHVGYLVLRKADDALVGVFNFSEIVRGAFQSTYLGYYAFEPHAGNGYMAEGLALALDVAYRKLRLHRVEVNVQPANKRSLALVERLGFSREGYSRRYVKIAGRWRDHVRFAMLAENWRRKRASTRKKLARA